MTESATDTPALAGATGSVADSWVTRAEAALDGRRADPDVTLVSPQRPALLDGDGGEALIAPLLAGFLWAAAIFRELQSGQTDPLALLLRWLALGLSVRAARLLWQLGTRFKLWLQAPRYGMAITDEGFLLRMPTLDLPVAKGDVIDVREQGDWRTRSGRRFHHVYVATRPSSGRILVTVPPVLDDNPGLLAERLMRWLGPPPTLDQEHVFPAPDPLPSKLYEAAAAGEAPSGVIALRHGSAWVERGPYFTVLLGLTLLERWLSLDAALRTRLGPAPLALIVTCTLIVPFAWWRMTRRHLAPRRGLSLVLTPAEMLLRTPSGIHRVPWKSLQRVSIEAKRAWSILSGNRIQRSLLIERHNEPQIRYDEVFLGMPAEAVAAIVDAYRRGRLP